MSSFQVERYRLFPSLWYGLSTRNIPSKNQTSTIQDVKRPKKATVQREPYELRSRKRPGTSQFASAFLSTNAGIYRDSRLAEINGLKKAGCFKVVDISTCEGHRLYRPVFVDKMKLDGEKKSRMCVAACNDQEHGLLTGAPTVKRLSMRILTSVAAAYRLKLFIRDVIKAFVQSTTTLRRPVYMRAPKEMGLPPGKVLQVLKPLYGMPESPMHWYTTYAGHHKEKMGMEQLPIDACLMYKRNNDTLEGLLGLQVDDTLYAGTLEFHSRGRRIRADVSKQGYNDDRYEQGTI